MHLTTNDIPHARSSNALMYAVSSAEHALIKGVTYIENAFL